MRRSRALAPVQRAGSAAGRPADHLLTELCVACKQAKRVRQQGQNRPQRSCSQPAVTARQIDHQRAHPGSRTRPGSAAPWAFPGAGLRHACVRPGHPPCGHTPGAWPRESHRAWPGRFRRWSQSGRRLRRVVPQRVRDFMLISSGSTAVQLVTCKACTGAVCLDHARPGNIDLRVPAAQRSLIVSTAARMSSRNLSVTSSV